MTYWWKAHAEVIRMILIATVTPFLIALARLDTDQLRDSTVWITTVGVAVAQAFATAVLAALGSGGFKK